MNDILIEKVSDVKYHQSLKYLSHLLKGEKRSKLILDIAQVDIFLASQCVMSSEANILLEKKLSKIAHIKSKSEVTHEKAKGFLALIELNQYELVHEVLLTIKKIDESHRYAIKKVIGELDSDSIVRFTRAIVETGSKGLISSVIVSVNNRDIEFNFAQKKEIEKIFKFVVELYGIANKRIFKYIMAFKLSKKLLPNNWETLMLNFIKRGDFEFIIDFYHFIKEENPHSYYDMCILYLSKNKYTNAVSFGKSFFLVSDELKQYDLIEKAFVAGKYFTALVLSLINSKTKLQELILRNTNLLKGMSIRQITNFKKINYPTVNQKKLLELVENISNSDSIIDKEVSCEIIGSIPKTIFVEILPLRIKGSIWVKEFKKEYIEDVTKLVKNGELIKAKVIGINKKYIQLSVIRIDNNGM